MDSNPDIELIFSMDDSEISLQDSGFLTPPTSEPMSTSLATSPSFEMPRGRTRSRGVPHLTTQSARYARADGSSMCRGRTRRRSISPAPALCTCSCSCSGCTAAALELSGPSGAINIPHSGSVSPSMALSPTRVFLHQLSFQNRRREIAPCRDPECNKKRVEERHGPSPMRGLGFSGVIRRRSRSRSRSRASADSMQPMSAKSYTSMSKLRYQVLLETGHSDEDNDEVDLADIPVLEVIGSSTTDWPIAPGSRSHT